MAGQHYCLRWNNYQSNMTSVFHHLLRTEAFVDVTLACNNDSLKAHKVVLSACSSYFQKILLDNPSQHPTIIMPHDVCFKDLTFIIEFVYRGEIDVSQSELQSLLKTADQLKIKGLCEVPDGENTNSEEMPEAELTQLPLQPHPPSPQSPSPSASAIARVNRFRRLSVQAKRRLDTRKRLFRDSLQKQQVQVNQVQQTQTVHTGQQTVHHQSQQTIHQNQPNLHQTHQTVHHQQQNIHQPPQNQQSVHQTQQNIHQPQQNVHQPQQNVHQPQPNIHQAQQNINQSQQNAHQVQQNVHQVQQIVHQQQTVHQAQQSLMQSQQHMQQQTHIPQQSQTQHLVQSQESPQQTQMIQAVVTTVHDPSSPHNQIQASDTLTNCITVATSTDDDLKGEVGGVVILESRHGHPAHLMMTSPPPIMSTHAHAHTHTHSHAHSQQVMLESSGLGVHSEVDQLTADVGTQNTSPEHSLMASPTHHQELTAVMTPVESRVTVDTSPGSADEVKVKYETLRAIDQTELEIVDNHISPERKDENYPALGEDTSEHTMHTMMITPELLGLIPSSSTATSTHQEVSDSVKREVAGSKTWTQEDMDAALDALRTHSMSLTKASITYGIPSTTLWQRAHRLGIDTPKKDGPAKSWTEDVLNVALEALRNGSISANKASKAYGIPSSTLYKIARREGIRLAAPFNAAPTTWSPEDLERALEAIRSGQTTVQRAAADFGIPSGTLYGRCKREGIELSRNNPTPWSEDAMTEALEAVRLGQMSINQAAIHYNLPYSSLYGRFKRVKYEADHPTEPEELPLASHGLPGTQIMLVQYQQPALYQHTPS